MLEVTLTYPTPEGSQKINIDDGRLSFGRGSEADQRFADDGLSRLHATIYRDGDRVWIVDENSSNGTFINGERAAPAGTPLRNGDVIKIGHTTHLNVRIAERSTPQVSPTALPVQAAVTTPASTGFGIVPVVLIAFAILVVSLSVVFIGIKVLGSGPKEVVTNEEYGDDSDAPIEKPAKDPKSSPTPKQSGTGTSATPGIGTKIDGPMPPVETKPTADILKGRKYLEASESEKREYLGERALKIAAIIGNSSSEAIPAAALDKIKGFADAYAKRISVKPLGGCRFGDNLQVTYERASKNAPFIVRAFYEKGTDPRIGLYLAMIESEHCICLQSPTGPLGMFQFTKATGEAHGLKTIKGASPTNPDERCEPEPAARAAASYMKALTGRYGTDASSVPLAIGSYNSGEGGLSSNLEKALASNTGLERDFWTLIANGDKLSKQFQSENFKYVPKFFAAAIIGENPQDFGLKLLPLSAYSK